MIGGFGVSVAAALGGGDGGEQRLDRHGHPPRLVFPLYLGPRRRMSSHYQ
jgi:hypothetical protein